MQYLVCCPEFAMSMSELNAIVPHFIAYGYGWHGQTNQRVCSNLTSLILKFMRDVVVEYYRHGQRQLPP